MDLLEWCFIGLEIKIAIGGGSCDNCAMHFIAQQLRALGAQTLTLDSRVAADVFFAVPGEQVDGRAFIPQAKARWVVAEAAADLPAHVLQVESLGAQLSQIAADFYGNPSAKMKVVGITGTNGKTSCAYFLAQMLPGKVGMLGTIGNGIFPDLTPSSLTTLDPITLQRYLADFQAAGVQFVVMEVSSHSLVQHRVDGVQFDVGLFTNLSRDHLDYHGSMAAYAAAKRRLFELADTVVLNVDDPMGAIWAKEFVAVTYCLAERDELVSNGVVGDFNALNQLAVRRVFSVLGLAPPALTQLRAPPGRMEQVVPGVFVDYAHTPDALAKALQTLKGLGGKLWCVFGCGGDRDQGKRRLMGEVALAVADHVIVTNDNPRYETPEAIAAMVVESAPAAFQVILDRREAIRCALRERQPGDCVLVAGKGHEAYQQVGDERHAFNDVTEILNAIT